MSMDDSDDHDQRMQLEDMVLKTPSRATTEESRSLDERPLIGSNRTGSIDHHISMFETPLSKQFSVVRESPKSIRQAPPTLKPTITPRKPSNVTKHSLNTPFINRQKKSPNHHISPKRNIIEQIGTNQLKSTETISTPGGSRISNRFWREIHGLNERKASTIAHGRITKHMPKVQQEKKKDVSKTWANDDGFWSAESKNAPVASAFNSKLFHAAEQERNDPTPSPPVQTPSFVFDEIPTTQDDDNMSVHSLYKNPLFKAAQQQSSKQHQQESLLTELESAKKRDEEIRRRNNIPAMNQNLLAELKAKHQAKLIDDSDSYKFC
ncbi:hypothetical protein BD560DRAFT_47775 [Blakeslea trispora]|nr:hypothetical protein BD560DRAFT_47775 [Blakeslea trispora]